jgi:hypothetical protein
MTTLQCVPDSHQSFTIDACKTKRASALIASTIGFLTAHTTITARLIDCTWVRDVAVEPCPAAGCIAVTHKLFAILKLRQNCAPARADCTTIGVVIVLICQNTGHAITRRTIITAISLRASTLVCA